MRRTAVGTGVLLAAGMLAVSGTVEPAYAKSDVSVAVSTRVARVGQGIAVTGAGGDDGVVKTYLCLDQRYSGGAWQRLGCAAHNVYRLTVNARAGRRGPEQFRARLMALRTGARHLTVDRVSSSVTVLAH